MHVKLCMHADSCRWVVVEDVRGGWWNSRGWVAVCAGAMAGRMGVV